MITKVTVKDWKTDYERKEKFYRTEGKWAMRDLPAGTYSIQAETREGTVVVTDVVLEDADERKNIELVLLARATVIGQIVSLETGEPVPGMRVMVTSEGGDLFAGGYTDSENITGADGRFIVVNAPAGKIRVSARPTGGLQGGFGFVEHVVEAAGDGTTDTGPLRAAKWPLANDQSGRPIEGDLGFQIDHKGQFGRVVEKKVGSLIAGGPAAQAGLKVGDVIVSVNSYDVRGPNSYLYDTLCRAAPGVAITLELERGETLEVTAIERQKRR